jgi:hypothetical protein
VWPVEIFNYGRDIRINGEFCEFDLAKSIARNDGLEWIDFISWFKMHPKKTGAIFTGQIISWSDKIYYAHPSTLTEKVK